jgi:shikimate kinase
MTSNQRREILTDPQRDRASSQLLAQRLGGVNLYLIGMMGSGKTTLGRILAQRLGYKFFDTDVLVEQATSMKVSDIFAQWGENQFRELETQVLAELSAYKNLAIATGGGMVLRRQNWGYLYHGITVWLNVPVEALYQRLQTDNTRPLLQTPDPKAKLESIYQQRRQLYAQADLQIVPQENESPEQLATRVTEEVVNRLKSPQSNAENQRLLNTDNGNV